ncbi:MAG: winged helix-turn-helix transcriptional regulator [Acidobacteriota bacterium]
MAERQPELEILNILESEPEITQSDLAARVGVAVGTVNWYLKRWAAKGYVKMRRIGRWRWHYLLTPAGIAEKTRLAGEYIEASFVLYRRTRAEAQGLLRELKAAGHRKVWITGGDSDIADIVKLTCLEMRVELVLGSSGDGYPALEIQGADLRLIWNGDTSKDQGSRRSETKESI